MPRAIMLSALTAMLAAGAASAQETERGGGFFEQLFGTSERVAPGPDRAPATGADRSPAPGPNRGAQSPGAEVVMRIDRLEAQIRQLTGAIEQLQFRNQQLEAQLKRMLPGTEFRSQEPAGAAPPPAAAPGRRGDAFDPALNPNAPGAPRALGSAGAPLAPMPDEPVGAPGGRAAGAPLDLTTLTGVPTDPAAGDVSASRNPGAQVATLPPSDSPKDAHDLAYGYILRKDYALAEDGFRSFLRRFPSDRLVPDAHYWLGESLFQRQRFRDAAEAFLNVSTKFETAARAPDALLRLGQSLAAMGEKEAACASFGEVLRKYPRAAVGVKQGVDREQKRVRC